MAATTVSEKPLPSQKYVPVVIQKSLSVGNIFSSVFYGGGGGDDGCGGGGYGDGGGGDGGYGDGDGGGGGDGGGTYISSVLVDSCDRKYDNLYK